MPRAHYNSSIYAPRSAREQADGKANDVNESLVPCPVCYRL